ncbi:Auxin-induced protein 5NG4 [Hordeum vulgare]|nr:Auxin-induced protein 5NG4 [Hordeum vulgare]
MQATSVKRYPAELSLTAWMATVGGVQSMAFTVLLQHEKEDWLIGFGLKFCAHELCARTNQGIACSGFTVFAQVWCTEKKGPVFVTMFNPVSTIMVSILAYFIFGESLYVGSIIGGVVVILGLYMLLWGKDKDQEYKAGAASGEKQAGLPDLDCEKQQRQEEKMVGVSLARGGSEQETRTTR